MEYKIVNFKNQKLKEMEGILYLTDENNKRKFVQIDLEKYGDLVEDLIDGLVADSRRNEESVPWEQVEAELIAEGKLDE